MYNNNEYRKTYIDTNECTSRGACSVAPNIAALQEVIMYFLKQIAHYVLELENLGANNQSIKLNIINDIATLVSSNEFSEKQLFGLIQKEYFLLEDTKKTYKNICKDENILAKELKTHIYFDKTTPISKAIALGEKLFLEKYNNFNSLQKNLMEILLILVKSTCINLIKITDFNEFNNEIYHDVLSSLDMLNHAKINNNELKEQINKFASSDHLLQLEISRLLLTEFGEISKVKVSHSSRKGKAILVSGNNFFDLLKILEETKDKNIDVYTHSNLLITHALKKFSNYENLQGHFGDNTENSILEFATFPGAILLTKNSRNNTEYLYRGRLFSNDYIVPEGVVKIDNDDFTQLIDTANNAKGFSKGKIKEDTTIGYNEEEITNQFDEIVNKLNNKELEKVYIIGMNAYSEIQKEYFHEFFTNMKKNEFAISFSYESKNKNVFTIDVGNYTPLATNILHKFFEKISIDSEQIAFFFTTCDVMSISNIIMLKNAGAKNLYMATCPPTLVNPSVFETLKNEYSIQETTNVAEDLIKIRKK